MCTLPPAATAASLRACEMCIRDRIELCRIVGAVIAEILPQRPAQQSEQSNKDQQRQLRTEGNAPLEAGVADAADLYCSARSAAVSYTHLDVYKRQAPCRFVCKRHQPAAWTAVQIAVIQ